MDFLDSLDLDVSRKRSRRVRSWYLYEQFKSLERNQVDAAQKLKDKSYQDKILRQELSERKARRRLYDEFGICHSDPRIGRSVKSEGANTELADDFFESFGGLKDVLVNRATVSSETCSQFRNEKHLDEDFKSLDDDKDDFETTSYADSVNSVVNIKSDETVTVDIDKDIEGEERTAAVDEINLFFDKVEENLQCIEKLTDLGAEHNLFENDSSHSVQEKEATVAIKDKADNNGETNIITMWSRLVSFAYQIVQLNHGNCYVDYGSQFLTAVLACDVLRRGINRMCHILQPYVSPINYVTDDSDSPTDSYKSVKRKPRPNRSRCTCTNKTQMNVTKHQITRKFHSENSWQHYTKYSNENRINEHKDRWASEPWRNTPRLALRRNPSALSKSFYSNEWPDFSNDDSTEHFLREGCKCRYDVLNPMSKLSSYFDSVLKEIDDSMLV